MVGASDQAGEGTEQGALNAGTGTGGKVWLDTPIMMIHNGTVARGLHALTTKEKAMAFQSSKSYSRSKLELSD